MKYNPQHRCRALLVSLFDRVTKELLTPIVKDLASSYRWVALGLALLSQFGISFVLQAPSPLAPLFQSEWGLTKAEVGFLSSATSTGAWSVVLVGGLLTDRFGIRRVMSLGMVATGSLLLSMALVGSLGQAMAVMFVAGLARGAVFPGATKAVLDWFPPRARATAMGIKQMGTPIAGIAVASLLPVLGLALGWRMAMALPGFFIALCGVVTAVLYREATRPGQISAPSVGLRKALGELMRNRTLLTLCGTGFCFLIAQLALLTYLALYLAEVLLAPVIADEATRIVAAGGYLAVCQVGGAFGRVSWGMVSDRLFRGRRSIVLAMVGGLAVLLSLVMGTLEAGSPLWLLTALVFAYGATAVGWNGVYNAMITEAVGRKYAATGVGLSMTLTEVGTIAGPPLFGYVVDVTHSYQSAWFSLGCVLVVGTLAAILAARQEKPPEHQGRCLGIDHLY